MIEVLGMATASEGTGKDESSDFDRRIARWAGLGAAGVALSSLGFAGAVGSDLSGFISVLAAGVAVGAAAAVVGALLGFLFGIPRTLQRETTVGENAPRYLANTNLEQISDWLTKILVGIGLVQIARAPAALAKLANAMAPMLGDARGSAGFGLTLCIFSAVFWFLLMYLWTRVRLKRELELADRDIVETALAVFTERSSADAGALSLVERQLAGQNPPSQDELVEALRAASKTTLVLIYQRAEDQRSRTWHNREKRSEHDRTIPVFRALIANDPHQQFHRHFGSLGFALKDADPADLPSAIDALTKAISIRGDAPGYGFALYEWNRAACRILMADAAGIPPSPEAEAEIGTDLRAASTRLQPRFFNDTNGRDPAVDAVASWLSRKGLTYEGLRS